MPIVSELNKESLNFNHSERLADYKQLRGGIEFTENIPKSETGKIMRKELKKMAGVVD